MKNKSLPVLLFLILSSSLSAQEYYNLNNSLRFADYLFKTRQYDLAAQEYERVVFLDSSQNDARLALLQSYRFTGQYEKSIQTLEQQYKGSIEALPDVFAREYIKSLILSSDLAKAKYFVQSARLLDDREKKDLGVSIMLLNRDWGEAQRWAKNDPSLNPALASLVNESSTLRYKKPGVALLFSALLPGSGKVYSGRWKDGLISLLFVSANAYQAYRGFSKKGIESVHGWVFGSFALGFYSGNLYGSYKSAKVHNQKLDDQLYKKAEHIIYSGF
jgi:tetratricopeptide (TPR) repeat protein